MCPVFPTPGSAPDKRARATRKCQIFTYKIVMATKVESFMLHKTSYGLATISMICD